MQGVYQAFSRYYSQLHVHPRAFKQFIKLTDGSMTFLPSLSPKRPIVHLNIDSLSHPSWNPTLRDKLLLSDHGEVAKFRSRFGADEDDLTAAASKFDGPTRKVQSQTPSQNKAKPMKKKK